ncbi:MAG: hypothetical protein QXP81_10385 [Nitrososphaerota archaeon]
MSLGPDEDVIEETTEEVVEEMIEEQQRLRRCRLCGEMIPLKDFMKHYRERHPEEFQASIERRRETLRKKKKKQLEELEEQEEVEKPTSRLTPDEIRTVIAIEGKEGLDRLKRKRLEEVLGKHPRVTSRMREWALFVWDTNETVRDDPHYLYMALKEAGLEAMVAKQIVDAVWSIEWKYAHILREHGIEPRWPTIRPGEEFAPSYPPYRPVPQPYEPFQYPAYRPQYQPAPLPPSQSPQYQMTGPQPPYQQPFFPPTPPQQGLTKEDVVEIVRSLLEEKKRRDVIQEMMERMDRLEEMITQMEMGKPQTESTTEARLKEIQEQLNEMVKQYYELQLKHKEELHARELQALQSRLKELEERWNEVKSLIAESRKAATIESYRSDVYRFLSDVGREVAERRPLETIGRMLFPERFGLPPAPKGPTIPATHLADLQQRGLVE